MLNNILCSDTGRDTGRETGRDNTKLAVRLRMVRLNMAAWLN